MQVGSMTGTSSGESSGLSESSVVTLGISSATFSGSSLLLTSRTSSEIFSGRFSGISSVFLEISSDISSIISIFSSILSGIFTYFSGVSSISSDISSFSTGVSTSSSISSGMSSISFDILSGISSILSGISSIPSEISSLSEVSTISSGISSELFGIPTDFSEVSSAAVSGTSSADSSTISSLFSASKSSSFSSFSASSSLSRILSTLSWSEFLSDTPRTARTTSSFPVASSNSACSISSTSLDFSAIFFWFCSSMNFKKSLEASPACGITVIRLSALVFFSGDSLCARLLAATEGSSWIFFISFWIKANWMKSSRASPGAKLLRWSAAFVKFSGIIVAALLALAAAGWSSILTSSLWIFKSATNFSSTSFAAIVFRWSIFFDCFPGVKLQPRFFPLGFSLMFFISFQFRAFSSNESSSSSSSTTAAIVLRFLKASDDSPEPGNKLTPRRVVDGTSLIPFNSSLISAFFFSAAWDSEGEK